MKRKCAVAFCTDQGQRFFGPGPCRLLRGVEALGSLRAAAGQMGMAYTKALGLIQRAEAGFGFPLIRRKTGGRGGGGSVLTPAAKELLTRYDAYEAACCEQAESLYRLHFSTFRPQEPAADRG